MTDIIRKLEEENRQAADNILASIPEDERIAWYNSLCTKALILGLHADRAEAMLKWEEGYTTDQFAEGTAQKNAELLAQVRQLQLFIERILEIKEGATEDDTENHAGGPQDIN